MARIVNLNTKAHADAAMALPEKLMTEDGREIKITRWTPTFSIEGMTTVEIEGIVLLSVAQISDIGHRASWPENKR